MTMDLKPYRTALFTLHDKHEIMTGLHEIQGDLDNVSFWILFREAWNTVRSLHRETTNVRDMLTAERLNSPARLAAMRQSEIDWLKRVARRGKPVKVYRGASYQNLTGFSWTTKAKIAQKHARMTGFVENQLIIGRIEPMHIILFNERESEVVCFPEHVKVEKVEDAPGLTGIELETRRVQSIVEAQGANAVHQLSPAEYFVEAVKAARADRKMVVDHMTGALELLETLGFKKRAELNRNILTALGEDDAIRRAE